MEIEDGIAGKLDGEIIPHFPGILLLSVSRVLWLLRNNKYGNAPEQCL